MPFYKCLNYPLCQKHEERCQMQEICLDDSCQKPGMIC